MIEAIDHFGIEMLLGSDSAFLDHIALALTNALTWVPLYIALLVLVIKNNDNMLQIALCFLFAALCPVISSVTADVIVKPWVERVRPCNDPALKYLVQIAGNLHSKDFSFFSAHAANTMSLAVFFFLMVRSKLLGFSLTAWSLTNCWTRLYLGQHYLTDIIVGIAVGALVGVFSYVLYLKVGLRTQTSQRFVSSQFTSTGYARTDIDCTLSILLIITLLLVIIVSPVLP